MYLSPEYDYDSKIFLFTFTSQFIFVFYLYLISLNIIMCSKQIKVKIVYNVLINKSKLHFI